MQHTPGLTPTEPPAVAPCLTCHRDTRTRICRGCRHRITTQLHNLQSLYNDLGIALHPGSANGDEKVTSSRTPPIPVRLDALNLRARGGIVTILLSWETDWRETLGFTAPTFRGNFETTLAATVRFLTTNLDWAADAYGPIEDFADEVATLHQQARTAAGQHSDYRYIGDCPTLTDDGYTCGRALYASPWIDVIECRGCGVRRHRGSDWLRLGMMLRQDTAEAS